MFLKLFSAIILGVRNFRVFEILEHLPYSLKLKKSAMIGCLRTPVRKQPIISLYFEFENELKFYNLEARSDKISGQILILTVWHSDSIPERFY